VRPLALLLALCASSACYMETWAGAGKLEAAEQPDFAGEIGWQFGVSLGTFMAWPIPVAAGLSEVAHRGGGLDEAAAEAIQGRVDLSYGRAALVGTGSYGWIRRYQSEGMDMDPGGNFIGGSVGPGVHLPWAPRQVLTLSVAPTYTRWEGPIEITAIGGEARLRWVFTTPESFLCSRGCPTFAPFRFGRLIDSSAIGSTPSRTGTSPARTRQCTKTTSCSRGTFGIRCSDRTTCVE
jgi:hypothetical protein